MQLVLRRRRNLKTDTHTEGRQSKDTEDGHPQARTEAWDRSFSPPLRRHLPADEHFDLGLLVSRTVSKGIFGI
jgi:hypothetical protein